MPIEQVLLERIKANDPTLQKLNLTHMQLNDDDIQQLVNVLISNTYVISLNVAYNQMGVKGAKALAGFTTLTSLNIYHNQIGDDGAEAFANNTSLTSLNVGYNQIGDAGAKTFINNRKLTKLIMYNNPIGDEWEERLDDMLLKNRQHLITLRRNQFLRTLILLAEDWTNPASQSSWATLPKDVALCIVSLIDVTSLDSIGKSARQIYQCAVFIFDHMPQLKASLTQAYRSKQVVKVIEEPLTPPSICIPFRFFPAKLSSPSQAKEISESSADNQNPLISIN